LDFKLHQEVFAHIKGLSMKVHSMPSAEEITGIPFFGAEYLLYGFPDKIEGDDEIEIDDEVESDDEVDDNLLDALNWDNVEQAYERAFIKREVLKPDPTTVDGRIETLKRLATFLEDQIHESSACEVEQLHAQCPKCNDRLSIDTHSEKKTHHNVWLADAKQIGSGDFAEIVKVVRFNSDLTKELRATLDALDKAITIRDRDYKKVPTFVTHLNKSDRYVTNRHDALLIDKIASECTPRATARALQIGSEFASAVKKIGIHNIPLEYMYCVKRGRLLCNHALSLIFYARAVSQKAERDKAERDKAERDKAEHDTDPPTGDERQVDLSQNDN
jgi:hypothetical protein